MPLPPRGDHPHTGCEALNGQLKAHLVVALSRTTMADSVRAFLQRDFHKPLGNARAGCGRAQEVSLVVSPCLHGRDEVVVHVVVTEVFHIQLRRACRQRLFLKPFQLDAQPHVSADRNDFTSCIVFLQPRDNHRGIKPSRVCQYYFFDFRHCCRLRLII